MTELQESPVRGPRLLLFGSAAVAITGFAVLLFEAQLESVTHMNSVPLGANLLLIGIFLTLAGLRGLHPQSSILVFRMAWVLLFSGVLFVSFDTPAGKFLRLDTGVIGWLLLIVGAGVGLYGLRTTRSRPDSLISFGEKTAWVSLAANVAITGYLIYSLPTMGLQAWKTLALIVAVIIIEGMALDLLAKRESSSTVQDERDIFIRTRSAAHAHTTLLMLLTPSVVMLGLLPTWLTGLSIADVAHQLILILIGSEVVRHASAVWLYRKDRS